MHQPGCPRAGDRGPALGGGTVPRLGLLPAAVRCQPAKVPRRAGTRRSAAPGRTRYGRGDPFPGLGPDWLPAAVRDQAPSDAFASSLRVVLSEAP